MGILTDIANAVAKKVVGPWVQDWDRKLKLDVRTNLLVLRLGPNLALKPDAINNLVEKGIWKSLHDNLRMPAAGSK